MLELPERPGPRPTTSAGIPHRQLDQTPTPALFERLRAGFLSISDAREGPSLISVPGARGLFLNDYSQCNTRYGFIRGREFAHLHPPDDGSLHMALAPDDCAQVLVRGWGELHPWAVTGRILPTIVLVYGPRDDQEVKIVLAIATASWRNAKSVNSEPHHY